VKDGSHTDNHQVGALQFSSYDVNEAYSAEPQTDFEVCSQRDVSWNGQETASHSQSMIKQNTGVRTPTVLSFRDGRLFYQHNNRAEQRQCSISSKNECPRALWQHVATLSCLYRKPIK